jgi:hypothetical protein
MEERETETPLDRPHRENGRKQNTNQTQIQQSRRTGRPRKRWVEDAEEDLRKMGVRGWLRKAKEKNEWAGVIKEAKVLQGL